MCALLISTTNEEVLKVATSLLVLVGQLVLRLTREKVVACDGDAKAALKYREDTCLAGAAALPPVVLQRTRDDAEAPARGFVGLLLL